MPITTSQRNGHGWQLIFADLALILFLLTLSALPAAEADAGRQSAGSDPRKADTLGAVHPEIAPAQALFRPVPGGPSLREWLAAQAPDPRATLTIFAAHKAGGEAGAWARASALAAEVRGVPTPVRTIITVGAVEDIYASLAYDERVAQRANAGGAS